METIYIVIQVIWFHSVALINVTDECIHMAVVINNHPL